MQQLFQHQQKGHFLAVLEPKAHLFAPYSECLLYHLLLENNGSEARQA